MNADVASGPSRRKIRIATFAVPLSGNKGSASMLLGLLDALDEEGFDVEAVVYSYYPRRDAEIARGMPGVTVRGGHPRNLLTLVPLLLLNRIAGFVLPGPLRARYRELARCDVVCLVGGTTFSDAMLYKVPWNVAAALPGFIAGRPVTFLSQTMGPFVRPTNRLAARWTLSRSRLVHGRGHRSAELVRALGVPHATYGPDLSLTMREVTPEPSSRLAHWGAAIDAHAEGSRGAIGVTPNTIVDGMMRNVGSDFAALMSATIVDLQVRGYRVVLIPHSYREGASGAHNNDTSLCRRILAGLPQGADDCLYVGEDLSSQVLRALIGRLRFLVASRFHSMVSALAVGVPPITIGWGHHKYLEVLEAFGVPELYLDYSQASLATLRARVDWLEGQDASIRQTMSRGLAEADRLARGIGGVLLDAAGGGPPRR